MKFWCATAWVDPTVLVGIAQLVDHAGYHGLMASDHLVFPRELASPYPYSPHPDGRPVWDENAPWPDPWVLFGAVAAVTTRLRFTTNIYVAPSRPLVEVAKVIGTVSVLSGGRVALGAGAGWMREEFDLQGASFVNRGKRFNEMIVALRELWKGGWVEFHGNYYDVPPLTIEPHPPEPIPIYLGGHSDAALRRAAQLGDGWIGNAYGWDDLVHYVGRLRGFLGEAGRAGDDFEIIAGINAVPDPDVYKRAEAEIGLTGTMCMPWILDGDIAHMREEGAQPSVEAYRPSIERFAEEIVGPCGS